MIVLYILIALALIVYGFLRLPRFGARPSGERLKRMQASPNYRKGQFQNLSPTPALAEDTTMPRVMKEFFFEKSKASRPPAPLPSIKTDLKALDPSEDVLVWFGHSSYFLQTDGKRILVDPVFSGHASPVRFTTRAFAGSDAYRPEDLPDIDLLLLSHDHWDHMDQDTLVQLRPRIARVVTGLGSGAHLERWNFDSSRIHELDWNDRIEPWEGFSLTAMPARHFSGRGLKRNGTLWLSFVYQTPSLRLFLGGDSGYDTHFKSIGAQYGPFDLAILENGQYNHSWRYIHTLPPQTVQAALDLKAARLLPVHWAKFSLALHAWNEPIRDLLAEAQKKNLQVLHPRIGEKLFLKQEQVFEKWWERL